MLKHLKINTKKISFLILAISIFMAPATTLAADPCADTTNKQGNVSQAQVQNCVTQTPFVKDIQMIVNFLSAGVGIIIIGMIILGGIQYSMAGGSADATSKAKSRIVDALIALFAYLLIYAFVQWLIPGGVFK